jgi:hypothetical protein
MPEDFEEEEDQEEQEEPQSRPVFSLPSVFPQSSEPESEPEPTRKPRTNDDAALDDDDIEEIFESGERSDGSVDELERDDFSDILDVSEEDITGEKPQPKPRQRFSRTTKRFRPNNPPPTVGGMQY